MNSKMDEILQCLFVHKIDKETISSQTGNKYPITGQFGCSKCYKQYDGKNYGAHD